MMEPDLHFGKGFIESMRQVMDKYENKTTHGLSRYHGGRENKAV